jgi:ABC-type nitrate/sulfonate/bicarbonate transport system permease component
MTHDPRGRADGSGGRRRPRVRGAIEASWFWAVIGMLLIVAMWSAVSGFHLASKFALPTPWSVAANMYDTRGALLPAMWQTTYVCLMGFAIGVAIGVALAVLMHFFPFFSRAVKPMLITTQTIPLLALAPILVLWFGFSITPKLIIVSLLVFFPVALNMADGLSSTRPELRSFASSLGASRLRILWFCELPSSLPQLFTGLRIAATYAVIAAVIAEWVGGSQGLGALMQRANFAFETDTVFATVVLMIVLGLAFYVAVLGLERLIIPWHLDRKQLQGAQPREVLGSDPRPAETNEERLEVVREEARGA